jgi:hypothetical protein
MLFNRQFNNSLKLKVSMQHLSIVGVCDQQLEDYMGEFKGLSGLNSWYYLR